MKFTILLFSAVLVNAATTTQAVNTYAENDMDPVDVLVTLSTEKAHYNVSPSPPRFLMPLSPVGSISMPVVSPGSGAGSATSVTQTVELGTAADYTILAKSGISTVPFSYITGNIAVSPIAATAMTGFGLALARDGQSSTATQVIGGGKAFAASYGGATAKALSIAVGDMEFAYADAAGRLNNDSTRINLKGGAIGGLTLTPGVYTFQTGVSIGTGTDVTFDAGNNANAVFIIQMTGNLLQAANTKVSNFVWD
jgi:hypothetical protein